MEAQPNTEAGVLAQAIIAPHVKAWFPLAGPRRTGREAQLCKVWGMGRLSL